MSRTQAEMVDATREPEPGLVEGPAGSQRPPSKKTAEFALDGTLDLPRVMTHRRLDGKVLFIVPDKSLWLTTSELGAQLLQSLQRGASLRHCMNEVGARLGIAAEDVRRELRGLLRQIEIKGFYETCVPEEAPASSTVRNLQIHLTQRCNLRCRHCYMDSGLESQVELSLVEWQDVIDQFLELGGTSLTYSGGEPLLFSQFFDLAAFVKKTPLETVLITNGTLIDSAAIAAAVARVVDKVRVSVDGATPEGHEVIRGDGTFAPTRQALVLLAETGVPVEVAVTMHPENRADIIENLPAFLNDLGELGVHPVKVGISRGMLQGRASRSLQVLEFEESSLEAKRRVNGRLWDLKRFRAVKVRSCGYGDSLTVLSTGEVLPCGIKGSIGAQVKQEPLRSIFARFQAMGKASVVTQLRPCRRCDLRYICGGGCRIVHPAVTGDVRRAACSSEDRAAYYRRLMVRDEVFFKASEQLDAP